MGAWRYTTNRNGREEEKEEENITIKHLKNRVERE